MVLNVHGLGFRPFFVEKPNGEYAGFELDTLRVMAEKVNATIAVQKADVWVDYELDDNGNQILLGPMAEVIYQRATFAIAEHYFLEDFFKLCAYLILTDQSVFYRYPKPQILPPTWNLIKPFTSSVWISVCLVLIILMIFNIIFMKSYAKVQKLTNNRSWFEKAIFIYMVQLFQGI